MDTSTKNNFENLHKEIIFNETLYIKIFDYIKSDNWDLVLKIIEENNIDYDIKDNMNIYILEYIISHNKIKVLQAILNKNIRINILDENNRSILYTVIKFSYIEILKELLKKDKEIIGNTILEITDNDKNIPLFYAIKFLNLEAVTLIMNNMNNYYIKNINGDNALHIAIESNNFEIFKFLLTKIKNVNIKNNIGNTPFHLIIINKCHSMLEYILNLEDLEYNTTNIIFYTPLHYLCRICDYKLFQIIKNKIHLFNGNIQDKSGNIFIHYFITYINKNFKDQHQSSSILEMYNILLKIKFNYNLFNIEGNISCHLLFDNFIIFQKNFSIIINNFIINSNLNIQNNLGESCFFMIVKLNYWKNISNLLINKKLDIFIMNSNKNIIFDFLSINEQEEFLKLITNSYINKIRSDETVKFYEYWDNRCKKNFNFVDLNETEKELISNIKIKNNENLCFQIIYDRLYSNVKEYIKTRKNNNYYSYPIKNIYSKLINNYPNVNLSTYTGLTIDVLSGLMYLNNKYKNDCFTTLQLININTQILKCNIHCEFIGFEINWIDQQLHIPENINIRTILTNNLNNPKFRFFIAPLAIEINVHNDKYKGHANIIIIDFKLKQIERFEPHGSDSPNGMNYNKNLLDTLLKNKFDSYKLNFKYLSPEDYLSKIGFQIKEFYELKNDYLGDPNGFCALWCTWWTEIRISNPDINIYKLQKLLFKEISNNNLSYKKLIRDYSYFITKFRDNILNKADVNINDLINDKFINDKNKITLLNNIVISECLQFI